MPPSTVSHFPPNYKHSHQPNLKSWEVNFAYKEGGTHKNALVKIRLCPECSYMLNYKKMKEKEELAALEAEKRRKKKEKQRKRKEREEEDGQDDVKGKRKSKLNKQLSDSQSDSEDDGNTDQDSEDDAKEIDKSESEKPVPVESLAAQIWGAPQVLETEKSKDEEMDDFFNDIFS
ncbi:hypothetical protein HDU99_003895 [Rhizoclosmatium hyalinum]|nr:hypothetical protein HDU99_003895 [Rhizoclosmatium hyalinum]